LEGGQEKYIFIISNLAFGAQRRDFELDKKWKEEDLMYVEDQEKLTYMGIYRANIPHPTLKIEKVVYYLINQ